MSSGNPGEIWRMSYCSYSNVHYLEFYALSPATHPAHVAASADFLPDPRTRLSDIAKQQHNQLVAPIQTKPTLQLLRVLQTWRYKKKKLHGYSTLKAHDQFTMFLHVCDDGNHDDAAHRNTWSTTRTAPIGGPSRSSGRFQFPMLLVCCQLPSVTEKATIVWKKWCLRQLSYLYLWLCNIICVYLCCLPSAYLLWYYQESICRVQVLTCANLADLVAQPGENLGTFFDRQ